MGLQCVYGFQVDVEVALCLVLQARMQGAGKWGAYPHKIRLIFTQHSAFSWINSSIVALKMYTNC